MLTADKFQTLGPLFILRFIGSQGAIEDYEIDITKGAWKLGSDRTR